MTFMMYKGRLVVSKDDYITKCLIICNQDTLESLVSGNCEVQAMRPLPWLLHVADTLRNTTSQPAPNTFDWLPIPLPQAPSCSKCFQCPVSTSPLPLFPEMMPSIIGSLAVFQRDKNMSTTKYLWYVWIMICTYLDLHHCS